MKKSIRAFIATVLAVVMAIPAVTAFAATDTEDKLEWEFYDETFYYDYAGEIAEGKNEIIYDGNDFIYFSFDAQNSGYYHLSFGYENMNAWIGVPEKFENGKAFNEASCIYYATEDFDGIICYFSEGKQIIALDLYYIDENASFDIEFYGEDITEIELAETLIYGYDIYDYDLDGSVYFEIDNNVKITFSSGKSITKDSISGKTNSSITSGENTLVAVVCGKEYELKANVNYVTDYVESAEISNIEDYLNIKICYDGYDSYEPYGETLTVKFKDGTTDEIVLNDDEFLVLPNGSEVWCYTDFESNGNEIVLNVYIANKLVKSYECIEHEANISENIDAMNSNNMNHLSDISYYIRRALIIALECGSLQEFMDYGAEEAALRFTWAFESFINIFVETIELIAYYTA